VQIPSGYRFPVVIQGLGVEWRRKKKKQKKPAGKKFETIRNKGKGKERQQLLTFFGWNLCSAGRQKPPPKKRFPER